MRTPMSQFFLLKITFKIKYLISPKIMKIMTKRQNLVKTKLKLCHQIEKTLTILLHFSKFTKDL